MSITLYLPVGKGDLANTLGQGINPMKREVMRSQAILFDKKENSSDPFDNMKSHVDTVSSDESLQTLTDICISGSYSGWGANVSASGELLMSKNLTVNSVSIVANATYISREEIINLQTAKLTDVAKNDLLADPGQFLKDYGLFFVAGYVYGGYFTGYYSLKATDTTQITDIAAKVSGSCLSEEGKVSATIDTDIKNIQETFHLETHSDYDEKGAKSASGATTASELLKNYYDFQKIYRTKVTRE
jgi:hypothetical protein